MSRLLVAFLPILASSVLARLSRTTLGKSLNTSVNASVATKSMPDIGAILKNAEALQAPQSKPQAAAGGQRKKLDVGLNDFEMKLEDDLTKVLFTMLPNSTNASTRSSFNSTLRSVFKAGFLEAVKGTKQKVAHNWLQLKPEKRENYFSAVKARYQEIFDAQEKRLNDRVKIAFFSDADLPPKASDATVKANINKLTSKVATQLSKQLNDYAEMFYMSNIFLRFRVKMSKKVLALASEKSVIVV